MLCLDRSGTSADDAIAVEYILALLGARRPLPIPI